MFSGSLRTSLLAVCSVMAVACGSTGPYVWADSLPTTAGPTMVEGAIQDGDTVNVKVFGPSGEPFSGPQKVRTDGKITISVIGDVTARGKKPVQLGAELQDRLKVALKEPIVSVTLEGGGGGEFKVSVLGEVKNAGAVQVDHGATVLHALAGAGGLSEYADADKVFVIRRALPQRVRFRYQDLRSADPKSISFLLQPGDVVVVE